MSTHVLQSKNILPEGFIEVYYQVHRAALHGNTPHTARVRLTGPYMITFLLLYMCWLGPGANQPFYIFWEDEASTAEWVPMSRTTDASMSKTSGNLRV